MTQPSSKRLVTEAAQATAIGALSATYARGVSVAKYGAAGDGIADDTAAVQAAIDAASAGAGVVWLPAGTYQISAPLSITQAVTIQGASGYKSRIRATALFPTGRHMIEVVKGSGSVGYLEGSHLPGVEINDLLLDGNARVGQVNGIKLDSVSRSIFRNVQMRWLRGSAWTLYRSVIECEWIGCRTWACGDSSLDTPVVDARDHSVAGTDGHNLNHFVACNFGWSCGDILFLGSLDDNVSVRGFWFMGCVFHGINESRIQESDNVYGSLGVTINRPGGVTPIPVRIADGRSVWFIGCRIHNPARGFESIRLESANTTPENTVSWVGGYGSMTVRGNVGYTGLSLSSIDTTTDTLTCGSGTVHDLSTGSRVQVKVGTNSTGTGVPPTGLTTGTDYYAIRVSSTQLKLATSRTNAVAGTAIDLTDAGTLPLTLAQFDTAATVDPATDTFTAPEHVLRTGARVRVSSTGTIPGGLALSTDYNVIAITSDTFKLATSRSNALAGTAIDLTDAGTGVVWVDTQDYWGSVELGTLSISGGARFDGTPRRAYVKTAVGATLNYDPLSTNGLQSTVPILEKSDGSTVLGTPSGWFASVAPTSGLPVKALKTANETRADATTVADAQLKLTLTPGTWAVTGWILYQATTTADLKIQWSSTQSGWTGKVRFSGQSNSATADVGSQSNQIAARNASVGRGGIGLGTDLGFNLDGFVTVDVAGDFQLKWAQNALDAANPTVIEAGSWVRAEQLS